MNHRSENSFPPSRPPAVCAFFPHFCSSLQRSSPPKVADDDLEGVTSAPSVTVAQPSPELNTKLQASQCKHFRIYATLPEENPQLPTRPSALQDKITWSAPHAVVALLVKKPVSASQEVVCGRSPSFGTGTAVVQFSLRTHRFCNNAAIYCQLPGERVYATVTSWPSSVSLSMSGVRNTVTLASCLEATCHSLRQHRRHVARRPPLWPGVTVTHRNIRARTPGIPTERL